jgi:2-polyprenyl-3-methyl-5-hydroxy-6-metoxy-1,4-benzoquinol methylase
VPPRQRYSPILVFVLAGVLGSGLNLLLTYALYRGFGAPLVAFFVGTLANQLFHHVFYTVVYENEEIRMRTMLPVQFLLYVAVAAAATVPLHVLTATLGWSFLPAVLACLALLAIVSTLVIRGSTFGSSTLAEVEYREMNDSFYDDQTDATKVSRFRAWYHRSRYQRLTDLVSAHYRPGMRIADLGCGNSWWNVHGLPVTGLDINEKMLDWAKRNGRLTDYQVCADLSQPGFPPQTFDVVVMSEVLEHLLNGPEVLAAIRTMLKDDGTFLMTVPYDIFLGPFFVLFNLNCLYQGYVKGSDYHRHRCGHINHFTKTRLRRTLNAAGFTIDQLFVVNGLLLYAVVRKSN